MRISDWSSDLCSSDLQLAKLGKRFAFATDKGRAIHLPCAVDFGCPAIGAKHQIGVQADQRIAAARSAAFHRFQQKRSEEHTSELQSLMRISYAVFCLQKQNKKQKQHKSNYTKNRQSYH